MNNTISEMKLVPISKLVPYANNARTHSPEQINKLRGSLREFSQDTDVLLPHGQRTSSKFHAYSSII